MSWTPSTVGGSPFDLAAMMLTTRWASSGTDVCGVRSKAGEAARERVLDPLDVERDDPSVALDDARRGHDFDL